jgi:oxygen-independent coproporphyrinogen-3 oxidase
VLDAETRRVERVLLEIRLVDGLDAAVLDDAGRAAASEILADGLIDADHFAADRLVLTRRGRLLADAVVRRLLR